jgi:ubiquinone/menaquinone biosynthesis C-methylase UbiE
MNDLMSVGIHRLWKMDLIRAINPVIGCNIVDVGGGTGDISLGCLKKQECQVTVCDINEKMV